MYVCVDCRWLYLTGFCTRIKGLAYNNNLELGVVSAYKTLNYVSLLRDVQLLYTMESAEHICFTIMALNNSTITHTRIHCIMIDSINKFP